MERKFGLLGTAIKEKYQAAKKALNQPPQYFSETASADPQVKAAHEAGVRAIRSIPTSTGGIPNARMIEVVYTSAYNRVSRSEQQGQKE